MCGIIGYTGDLDAACVMIKGLRALEYRGYDSAGVALEAEGKTQIIKCTGRVSRLEAALKNAQCAHTGIGHTRWATHGEVSEINSHPHSFNRVTVVHNGIIENYKELIKKYNLASSLISQTDSEVAAAVIDKNFDGDAYNAIRRAVSEFKGTYALAVMFDGIEGKVFAVRNVSPIVICKTSDGVCLASDAQAISLFGSEYFVLPELTVAEIGKDGITLTDMQGGSPKVSTVDGGEFFSGYSKGGYPFYMEKEICEQPQAIERTIKPRIKDGVPDFSCDSVDDAVFENITDISVIACGTAMHAGLIGKSLIEQKAKIPCTVHLASEFTYSNPIIKSTTLLICVSQSGETVDTLEALKYGKKAGAKSLSIINVPESSIARESDYVIYTHAGPEIAVASTKAYTTQLAVFYLIAARLAYITGQSTRRETQKLCAELSKIPDAIRDVLGRKDEIERLSKKLITAHDVFMIGRGLDYPALLEASLKLKEISYIHCEAFASGELKHGTIALITNETPVIALITQTKLRSKEISNIKEMQSRGANVIEFVKKPLAVSDGALAFELPDTDDRLAPFTAAAALQLLAYYVSRGKGLDADKPRNLAKVVTVE